MRWQESITSTMKNSSRMIFTFLPFFLILVCPGVLSILTINAQYLLGYPIKQFLKLAINIPLQGSRTSAMVAVPPVLATKYPCAYERLHEYLHNMLKPMLEWIQSSTNPSIGHPVLREKGVSTSVKDLKCQIELFWNGKYPFRVTDAEKITDPLGWWRDIGRHDGAKVLSVWDID